MKAKRFAIFAALAAKFAKFLKLLKFGKILLTFLSMIFSTLIYALFLGPWFAIGLILMLFIHEMGHIIALRIKGYDTPGPVFIPFLGAAIFAPKFHNPEEEAFIGYGGPLLGGLAAILLFVIWKFLPGQPQIILLISYFAVFLNLFNLIPVRPLDGGRITQAIGSWFKYLGIGIIFGLLIYLRDPFFAIILIFSLSDEDFKINPRLKLGLGVAAQLAYNILLFMAPAVAYHEWYLVLLSGIFTAVLNLLFLAYNVKFYKAISEKKEVVEEKSAVQLPASARWKWLILYLGLGMLLIFTIALQHPYLPKK